MNILIIIFDIVMIFLLGYAIGVTWLYPPSYPFLKKLSLSYALGFGFIGIQMFILSVSGIRWNYGIILTPWVIFICYFFLKNRNFSYSLPVKLGYVGRIEKILMSLLVTLVLFIGIESVMRPIQAWDGWDNWVFRANVFYLNEGIDHYYFAYTTDSYPLIIPLTTSLGYITIGEIDDKAILLFYYLFYVALGILFYISIRDFASRRIALLFTLLLLSSQNLIRHGGRYEAGQADLAVGFYIFACVVVFFDYLKFKSNRVLLLLSILLGIASQIKNDTLPFILLALCIIIFQIFKEKKYTKLLLVLPLPIILVSWELFKRINNLHPNFLFRNGVEFHIERLFVVLFQFGKEFVNIQNWNLLWIIFLFCILVYRKQLKGYFLLPTFLFFQLFFYLVIFLIIPQDPVSQIIGISNKLLLHVAPIAALIIAIITNRVIRKKKI